MLRPGGRLLFIEHVRSDDPKLARKQDRMNGINRFMVGCDCNRPTLDTIEAEGFDVTKIEHTTAKKVPKLGEPVHRGQRYGHQPAWASRQAPLTGQERS